MSIKVIALRRSDGALNDSFRLDRVVASKRFEDEVLDEVLDAVSKERLDKSRV